jgi:hypothetical protein
MRRSVEKRGQGFLGKDSNLEATVGTEDDIVVSVFVDSAAKRTKAWSTSLGTDAGVVKARGPLKHQSLGITDKIKPSEAFEGVFKALIRM